MRHLRHARLRRDGRGGGGARGHRPSRPHELRNLIELANRYLSRLFKEEHYQNRMRDMETVITQMQTVMESMADPVILTDPQHRVKTQNKAAERISSCRRT